MVILYGSFYPFDFYAHQDPRGPLGVLLASRLRSASHDDVIANIFLYIPFGFFAACALRQRWFAALAGFALSLSVELLQFYDHGRFQEISDVCANTLGALLGVAAVVILGRRLSQVDLALLLVCWLGSRWYPASPPAPSILAIDLFRFFAAWLAVGLMLEALTRSRIALPIFLAVSLAVHAIVSYLEPAEIAGGAAAALLWTGLLWRVPARAKITAALFTVLVVLLALSPFHFSSIPREFSWIPFRSLIESPTGTAIRVFLEKAFYYGGMVWLLARAGFSIGAAAAFGTILVFALRLLQVYLPGRSAEITDAILVAMLAAMIKLAALAGKISPEDHRESA